MAHRVGIDLGTTNSAIAFTELGQQRCVKVEQNEYTSAVFPSCVGVDKSAQPIYGARARREPTSLREFKRDMGTDKTYQLGPRSVTPVQLSALLLAEIRESFERLQGPIEGAVITVPANYNDRRRAAVREAGLLAGIEVLRTINEPSAAAIAYSLSNHRPGENAIVIDWGGGTLDVSLLDCVGNVLDVKANDGDEVCGGKDIDEAILGLLRRQLEVQLKASIDDPVVRNELLLKCEAIKIHLSNAERWDEPIDLKSTRTFLEVSLGRYELEGAIQPLVDRVMAAVERCLAKSPEGALSAREVTDVILVGGSCYLPLLQRRVREFFGRAGRIDLNPMEVVALGAAYQAQHSDETGSLVTIHSLTKGLGTACLGHDKRGVLRPNLYAELLPATSKLPARATKTFFTVHDNQEAVEIGVYENDDGRELVDGLIPWSIRSMPVPPAPAGSYPIELTFDYSVDQTLSVSVRIPGTRVDETWKADHVVQLESERGKSRSTVESLRNPSLEALGAFVQKVRSSLNGKADARIRQLLSELEAAIERGSIEEARRVKRDLSSALFDAGIVLA